tara:strand:+ start:210 stop:527 length:318 start_codon:yes stop_codon:yes gene_type:complete
MIAFISVLYVFAFIITYESLGMWSENWSNEEERFVGGLFYFFWKKLALRNGINPKKSYVSFGRIVALIFYLLPLLGGILWALWYWWGPASIFIFIIGIFILLFFC